MGAFAKISKDMLSLLILADLPATCGNLQSKGRCATPLRRRADHVPDQNSRTQPNPTMKERPPMPQTGNRAYGLAGVERKQTRRLLRRANKGLPSRKRRRAVKDQRMAQRLAAAQTE